MFVAYGKRHGIPSNTLAGLMNSLRMDEHEEDESKYISKHKIDNQWEKIRHSLSEEHSQIKELECIKFDGKKDSVRAAHNKEKTEDKITIIYEPPGSYLHHFDADDGTALTIAKGVLKVIHLYNSEKSLLALGGDNCPTNTGSGGGAFFWIQHFLERPLQLVLCLLHFIELPMKHLIKFYVGPTSGPRSWSSKLGKEISNLKNNLKNIVDFEPIKGRVIAVDEELLTNGDQKYAYYLALGIQKGPEFLREIMGECPDLPCSMSLATS